MAVTDLTGDAAAIAVLHESFEAQKAAFLNDPYPSAAERRERVLAVADQVVRNRMGIREAMSADFGVHPTLATDLIEVLGLAGRAAYAAEQLEQVDGARAAPRDPALYGSGARLRAAAAEGRDRQHRALELPVRPVASGPLDRDARRRQPGGDQALGVHAGVRASCCAT